MATYTVSVVAHYKSTETGKPFSRIYTCGHHHKTPAAAQQCKTKLGNTTNSYMQGLWQKANITPLPSLD